MILSKSQIMRGLQCEKYLYLDIHHRSLATKPTESQQAIFDQGNEVGIEAQKMFPEGVLVECEYWDTRGAFLKTEKLIQQGAHTLFEAAIVSDGMSARADILKKDESGIWEIIEVKSTTSVKDQHIDDAAIQFLVFKSYGLKLEKVSIMHVNNKCVAPVGDNLFKTVDVTEKIKERLENIKHTVAHLKQVLGTPETPTMDIGQHCHSPYECTFVENCWKHIPTPSVFDLPKIGKKAFDLYQKNKFKIEDLDAEGLNSKQTRALEVLKSGKQFIDKKIIQSKIESWQWPIYFLDFETFNPAIPIYEGTHPFQQIPFQFSCHVLENLESQPTHFEYLHADNSDPREFLKKALVKGFGTTGSVVAYNKKFEASVMSGLGGLENVIDRLVDPWPIIESAVYDKGFLGSYSLKSVAPALLGKHMSYEDLLIAEGGAASRAYLGLIKGEYKGEEGEKIRNAMLRYCRQDTLATVELVKWLYNVSH